MAFAVSLKVYTVQDMCDLESDMLIGKTGGYFIQQSRNVDSCIVCGG